MFYLPTVRREHEAALRRASEAHHLALAGAALPEREAILGELHLRTIPRTEGRDEAVGRHRKLVEDVADIPADILAAACDAYVKTPGNRFYPTAGEIRAFADPLISRRTIRRARLLRMADAAAEAFDPSDRCTPEQAMAILERTHPSIAAKLRGEPVHDA